MAENDLDYKKAVRIAIYLEAVEKDSHVFGKVSASSSESSSSVVNKITARGLSTGRDVAYHNKSKFFFKSVRCHRCGEVRQVDKM